jgi:hypothetical protein
MTNFIHREEYLGCHCVSRLDLREGARVRGAGRENAAIFHCLSSSIFFSCDFNANFISLKQFLLEMPQLSA